MHDPQSPPDAAPRKPVSLRLIQVLLLLIALCVCALPFFFLQMTADVIEGNREVLETLGDNGMEDFDPSATPMEYATGELIVEFSVAMSLVGAALIVAPLSAVGLQKRKRWARLLTAIWAGIVLLPFGFWAAWALASKFLRNDVELVEDYYIGPIDPITFNAGAGSLAFVCTLLVFILALTRGMRRWAPKQSAVPPAFQSPGAPWQFGGPRGFAPQQMRPDQFQPQGQFPPQQGPGQSPYPLQPPGQQYPPQQQQPPYGGY